MRNIAALITLLVLALPQPVAADRSAEAERILTELEAAKDRKTRLSLIDELVGLAPTPTPLLKKFLEREHKSSNETRRALLKSIGAAVPNAKGSFRKPGRQKKESLEEGDRFDWADKLADKKPSVAVGEVMTDIAVIRTLARSDDPEGAHFVLLFGFAPKGIIYRDEIGRYLRRGQPLSVPGLIRGVHHKDRPVRSYATYQLERVDRQAPHKALRAAQGNETLAINIFKAYEETLHREAVYVILDHVNDPSDSLRAAAREAWMAFVKRKPKNPAPRRRLSLPGGGYTKTTSQLYYDHQELAGVELRKRLEALTGSAPGENATLLEMTETLFSNLDQSRSNDATGLYDEARKAAASGDHAAAAQGFDRVLAIEPEWDKRTEIAATYLTYGKQLLDAEDFEKAAVVLRKAHEVDPEGPSAKAALASAHIARARVIEAAGGDSAAELAKAKDVDPSSGSKGRKWMMFLGIGAALAGLFLLIAGSLIRRR